MNKQRNLSAGDFSTWLRQMRRILKNESDASVPCGECNACCRSSYFIHIRPDETNSLAKIPLQLLFPAPGLSKGNMLLGYDKKGRCPMLIDDACSIYENRPLTCRGFDCRIFPAAGITTESDDTAPILSRIPKWTFSYATESDRNEHEAVKNAQRFLRERRHLLPEGFVPSHVIPLAVLAIKVYKVFMSDKKNSRRPVGDDEIAQGVVEALREFNA